MMRIRHRRGHVKESQHTHRWLVSYADYMTIMFALFVVMYAIAINKKDEEFAIFSQTLEQFFDRATQVTQPILTEQQQSTGDGVLQQPLPVNENVLEGESIVKEPIRGSKLIPEQADVSLIEQKELGEPLETLLDKLTGTLLNEIRQGDAQLQLNENWLTIEMSSGLLFPSASATVTNRAEQVVARIAEIISPMRNYLRVRGYTDDRSINNEMFRSNWQLSAARAAAVVKELQTLGINPARMALEGYGQYTPFADNDTAQGRAQNRKVVIAISKFALPLQETPQQDSAVESVEPAVEQELPSTDNTIKIIQLPHGGIRITTRNEEQQ
ncbi:OmpA family protein [Pseudoalteromonas sp. CNC9-20]|uniref:OmpA family protein n=1 Tax=Pseudoalteromonas TaxID=53246 RepID=UPI00034794E9|nr:MULTISPECIES: OmpA family protein [Pseudoalteromonas]MCG7570999.1 OmpA family protein [Pseudoalteromonas sp. CNC9-20]